jgi:hypothetical protein
LTTEFQDIILSGVDFSYCEEIGVQGVELWTTESIVKLIQLMDAELQRRYDEEQAIRQECHEAFQTDLFNQDDDSDAW